MENVKSSLCTVHLGYLQMLLDCLRQNGVDVESIYGADTIQSLAQLDPNTRRPIEEWDRMMEQAQAHTDGLDAALTLAEFVKPWDTGPIGFITMASRNLQEAVESLAQFYNLLNDVYDLQAEILDERFEIRMVPLGAMQSAFLERLTLATIAWHGRWLSRRADIKMDAFFAFPEPAPQERKAYEKTFGGKVTFNAPQSYLRGPAEYASYPVSRADHGVQDALRAQLMAEMASLHDTSSSFVHKIERILKPRLETGAVNLEDVAAEAGVSVRTLQTRLDEAGMNFRTMLDRMRFAQAQLYMGDPDVSLIEMAQMLGFATQSSFHHAFKRWTDMTPGEYRKQRQRAGLSQRS